MRYSLFIIMLSLFTQAFAQSHSFVSDILGAKRVTAEQVSYLIAVSNGSISEKASPSEAFDSLQKKGIVPKNWKASKVLNYGQVAKLMVSLWKIKGGLFFQATKNEHYSFRQLKSDNVIPKNADPQVFPTGSDVLNIYTMGEAKYR